MTDFNFHFQWFIHTSVNEMTKLVGQIFTWWLHRVIWCFFCLQHHEWSPKGFHVRSIGSWLQSIRNSYTQGLYKGPDLGANASFVLDKTWEKKKKNTLKTWKTTIIELQKSGNSLGAIARQPRVLWSSGKTTVKRYQKFVTVKTIRNTWYLYRWFLMIIWD